MVPKLSLFLYGAMRDNPLPSKASRARFYGRHKRGNLKLPGATAEYVIRFYSAPMRAGSLAARSRLFTARGVTLGRCGSGDQHPDQPLAQGPRFRHGSGGSHCRGLVLFTGPTRCNEHVAPTAHHCPPYVASGPLAVRGTADRAGLPSLAEEHGCNGCWLAVAVRVALAVRSRLPSGG